MANTSLITAFIVLNVSAAITVATSICKSLVETQGYICQQHIVGLILYLTQKPRINNKWVFIFCDYGFQVATKDGYILGMQRIPMGRSANKTANNSPPVLLQHGLLAVSSFNLRQIFKFWFIIKMHRFNLRQILN